jgi:hypothetical protein
VKVVQEEGNGEEDVFWIHYSPRGPAEKAMRTGVWCEHQRSLWQLSCLLAKMRGMISGGTVRTASRITRQE